MNHGKRGGIRFKYVYDTLEEAQNNSYIEYYKKEVREDEYGQLKVMNVLSRGALLPTIEIVIDEKIGGKEITNFAELVASSVRNKEKYIKDVILHFDPQIAVNFTMLYRNYTEPNYTTRSNFKSIHSFKLDSLARSIKSAQYNTTINRFSFERLQKIFGTNYKNYKHFKSNLLNAAIEDMNKNAHDIFVEIVEHRINNKSRGKIEYISFKITERTDIEKIQFALSLEYYIASQHFYSTERKIDFEQIGIDMKIEEYEESIKSFVNNIDNEDKSYSGQANDLTIAEWRKEYEDARLYHNKIIEACQSDSYFFERTGLYYDRSRLALMHGEEVFKVMGIVALDNPIKVWKFYENQKSFS